MWYHLFMKENLSLQGEQLEGQAVELHIEQ